MYGARSHQLASVRSSGVSKFREALYLLWSIDAFIEFS